MAQIVKPIKEKRCQCTNQLPLSKDPSRECNSATKNQSNLVIEGQKIEREIGKSEWTIEQQHVMKVVDRNIVLMFIF